MVTEALNVGRNGRERSSSGGEGTPELILIGGGMGAGKSTVIDMFKRGLFNKEDLQEVVVVEADAMKMKDPVFQALQVCLLLV